MQRTLLTTLLCSLLAACSSEPVTSAAASPEPVPAAAPVPAAVKPVAATAETEAARRARVLKSLAERSIYFDYDNFAVKPAYQDALRLDYELLRALPNVTVRLEGNADERGSTEYNLALGQKRAEAVRRALEVLGLPAAQVEAVSYGKERPKASCHDESCWAENRRVDFADRKP